MSGKQHGEVEAGERHAKHSEAPPCTMRHKAQGMMPRADISLKPLCTTAGVVWPAGLTGGCVLLECRGWGCQRLQCNQCSHAAGVLSSCHQDRDGPHSARHITTKFKATERHATCCRARCCQGAWQCSTHAKASLSADLQARGRSRRGVRGPVSWLLHR